MLHCVCTVSRPSADPHADAPINGLISALLLFLLATGPCGVLLMDIIRTVGPSKLRQAS